MHCPNCGLKSSETVCPNCGQPLPGEGRHSGGPISRYFEDVKSVLLKPHQFFRQMPRHEGLTQPLAFALIAHWLGTAIGYLWSTLSVRSTSQFFDRWASMLGPNDQIEVIRRSTPWASAQHLFSQWFWGMGSVIGDPFYTLIVLLLKGFFVFLGARLFVGLMTDSEKPHPVTYESAIRILCYGTAASIFLALPFFGRFIAWAYGLYICVVGAKEVYRVQSGRALLIVLFPQLLFITLTIGFLTLGLLLGIGIIASLFSGGF